jgi:succinate dehydrogenase/fumarate reductase flavoprotein subunit
MANESKMSRRQFVGTAAAGAAALGAVAGVTTLMPKAAAAPVAAGATGRRLSPAVRASAVKRGGPIPVPSNWSMSADVVVVGYGGAGGVSAISAYEAGASVIILEKTPSYASLGYTAANKARGGGGNTTMNAGNCICASDPIRAATYYFQTSMGNTPMDVCEAQAWMEVEDPAWCTAHGITFTGGTGTPAAPTTTAEFASIPGATGFQTMSLSSGDVFFGELEAIIQKMNIPVLFNTPATDLIQDPNTKEILGVQALANNSEVLNIQANKGVILTTGSIEFNESLKSMYYRNYPAHYYGWPFCTGDGAIMASKVGAALWHMPVRSEHILAWFPYSTNPEVGPIGYSVSVGAHAIYVDKLGNRFANESLTSTVNFDLFLDDYDINVPWYTRVPAFYITDSQGFASNFASGGGSTTLPTYIDPRVKWSNATALANGWILQGPDIPTLVATMNATTYVGLDSPTTNPLATATINMAASNLEATIATWNTMVAAGKGDTVFGRASSSMGNITTPPYYAMPLWPGGPSAMGGPARNAMGQIIDIEGNPIPRLYEAGENGSIDGMLCLGANNAAAIAWGRISGGNAASESPWS